VVIIQQAKKITQKNYQPTLKDGVWKKNTYFYCGFTPKILGVWMKINSFASKLNAF
jgi:hypothetical protein